MYRDTEALRQMIWRWCPSIHTFFFVYGEFTVTLEDIENHWMLSPSWVIVILLKSSYLWRSLRQKQSCRIMSGRRTLPWVLMQQDSQIGHKNFSRKKMMHSIVLPLLCTSYVNVYSVSILITLWNHFTFDLLWKFLLEQVSLWLPCFLANFILCWIYCILTRWLVGLVTLWLLFSTHKCCRRFFGSMPKVIVLIARNLLSRGRNLQKFRKLLLPVLISWRPVCLLYIAGLALNFMI